MSGFYDGSMIIDWNCPGKHSHRNDHYSIIYYYVKGSMTFNGYIYLFGIRYPFNAPFPTFWTGNGYLQRIKTKVLWPRMKGITVKDVIRISRSVCFFA